MIRMADPFLLHVSSALKMYQRLAEGPIYDDCTINGISSDFDVILCKRSECLVGLESLGV